MRPLGFEPRLRAYSNLLCQHKFTFFQKEKSFKAHITVARVKYVADKKAFLYFLASLSPEMAKFEVNGFKLMSSVLGGIRQVYEELAVYG